MRKLRIFAYMCLLTVFAIPFWAAQHLSYTNSANNLSFYLDSINPLTLTNDSLHILDIGDSVLPKRDTLSLDTIPQKNTLDAIVDYKSTDSLVMTKDNWGYLFGDAKVDYEEIKLTGEIISMNMDSSFVEAKYGLDSIGTEFGYPIFTDSDTEYETKTMKYNFKTKKGFGQHLVTEQGEGYVVAGIAKKNEDNTFFMREGKYTTCDQHDHPHFYLALTKAKVHPKKNVVTGPAYLVIEGLHIPFIGLPFGFFPFSDKYSSGVIMPSYGNDMEKGFNLTEGGYYFAINDYVDLKLLGTIYTKGSWGLNAQSTYRKRYKFSGNVDLGYQVSKVGDKGLPDYMQTKDMKVNWQHSQDPKANMFRTFSASVNFSTQSYDRNHFDNQFGNISTSNTKSSNVNFTQRFPNSPWSISASMSVNQVTSTKSLSIVMPNLVASMTRIYPFKRKEVVGSEKWYEKIQFSYTGDFRNSINTTEDDKSFELKRWNNAMQHRIPVSATFTILDYLNITPSVNYTERWYTKKYDVLVVNGSPRLSPDNPTTSFKRVYDFSASLGLQTKMYGFFSPLFAKSTTIRHVFTPSVTLNYAPDFSQEMWGYYNKIYGYDPYGALQEHYISPYGGQMFGMPGIGSQGTINFNFQNNIEMKIPWESDSTGYKKISLIDNLGISFGYNTQAEKFRWSNIGANIRLKLSQSLTVNLNAAFDPYMYEYVNQDPNVPRETWRIQRVDKMRIGQSGAGFAKLISTGYSISPTINQDTFNKWFGKDKKKKESDKEIGMIDEEEDEGTGEKKRLLGGTSESEGEYDEDGYLKNEVKWSLGFSFGMNYSIDGSKVVHGERPEPKMAWRKNLSFNGSIQPTKNWSLTFYGSYDFDLKNIPHMSCSITRDLHCWSISASFTPVGPYKNYYVSLRASSSMLQDLKHEFKGRASSYDPKWD